MAKTLGKLTELWNKVKIGIGLFFDKKVPWFYKLLPLAAVVYLIYPFDFISDLLPFLGQLDDLTILGGALAIFTKLAKAHESGKDQSKS